MSTYETRRQEHAAWLMYQLGFSRRHADAITRVHTARNRRTLIADTGAFRIYGFTDTETVAWFEAGVAIASLASIWREGGHAPTDFAALRDECIDRDVDEMQSILERVLEEGIPTDFALLCIRAGVRTDTELTDWHQRDLNGEDIRQTLTMLAGHAD